MTPHWFTSAWPAPAAVRTCVTTRKGGVSQAPWDSCNLGTHVGDDPANVAANRAALVTDLGCSPAWLEQTHSVLAVPADAGQVINADASWTITPGIACTVMTADCLPVLFCDRAGSVVAAAHAGWRGLAGGVLENTIAAMGAAPADLLAWMGPAIGLMHLKWGRRCARPSLIAIPLPQGLLLHRSAPATFLPTSIILLVYGWKRQGLRKCMAAGSVPFPIRNGFTPTGVTAKPAALPR